MEPIWKKQWPASIDEASLRLPEELLPVTRARQARRVPAVVAIQFYGRAIAFAELHSAVGRFAGFLAGRGVQAGDRVAISLENCPQFAIAYYGALRAGAIVVCLNPMHKASELLHEFNDSGAQVLVTSVPGYQMVAPIRAQTGLSTIVLTEYRDYLPEQPSLPPPPSFLERAVECQMNMMAYLGTPLVAIGRFDLVTVLRAIELYRCTMTTLITTVNVAIVNFSRTKEFDLSSLRHCFSGGAPVPPAIARRWEEITGHKLIEGYGLSETSAPTHINPPHRPKYGTIGVPIPFTQARIVDSNDAGTELAIGQSGELAVRGPQVMKGYWRNPEASARAFHDGWFLTGDIGRVDEEGYFVIEERKKDLLKVSGFSVFPAEVEAIMFGHPAIAEVGVVGVKDPYRGEDPVAFVVLKPGAKGTVTEAQLVDWCRSAMSVYKAPRQIRFLDALPKTASGKVLKRVLREQAAPTGGES